jgi:hypothetical protein
MKSIVLKSWSNQVCTIMTVIPTNSSTRTLILECGHHGTMRWPTVSFLRWVCCILLRGVNRVINFPSLQLFVSSVHLYYYSKFHYSN